MRFHLAASAALALLLWGCSAAVVEPSPSGAPPSSTAARVPSPGPAPGPAPSGPPYSTWRLGEQVLELRADGYGEIRRTPRSLRVRRYPTADALPPPSGRRFESTVGPMTGAVRARMGATWSPACPLGLDELRYVTVSFRGFDGAAHTGELVVAASAASDIVTVFRALYAADFPIEEMRLPGTADLDAPPTGDGNNTAAYVCRPTTGQDSGFSAHAYGLALDLNPFQNPYLRGDLVLPELAGSYLDRAWVRPGMVLSDSVAVRAFARIGWSWGGDFQTLKDYQHFTGTGR